MLVMKHCCDSYKQFTVVYEACSKLTDTEAGGKGNKILHPGHVYVPLKMKYCPMMKGAWCDQPVPRCLAGRRWIHYQSWLPFHLCLPRGGVMNLDNVARRCKAQFWGAGLPADSILYLNCSLPCKVLVPKNQCLFRCNIH